MDRRPVSKRTVQQILSVSDVALSRTTRVRKSVSKHVPRALSVGDAGGSGSGSGSGTSVGGVASAAASVVASVSSNSVCSSVCSNANTVGSVTGSSDVAMPPMLMNLGLPTPTLPVHLASSSLPGAGAVPAVPGMPATHLLGKSASVPQWQRQPSQPPLPQQQQQQQQQQLTTQQIQAAPQQQARFLSHMPPSVTRTGSHLRILLPLASCPSAHLPICPSAPPLPLALCLSLSLTVSMLRQVSAHTRRPPSPTR
ncbi:MAG: hypothetical protein MHM6MM_009077 [Cercozoa sp. M6MM]